MLPTQRMSVQSDRLLAIHFVMLMLRLLAAAIQKLITSREKNKKEGRHSASMRHRIAIDSFKFNFSSHRFSPIEVSCRLIRSFFFVQSRSFIATQFSGWASFRLIDFHHFSFLSAYFSFRNEILPTWVSI